MNIITLLAEPQYEWTRVCGFSVALLLAALAIIFVFLWLGGMPGRIARKRHHPDASAIWAAGWLGIFLFFPAWVAALVWAYTGTHVHPQQNYQQYQHQQYQHQQQHHQHHQRYIPPVKHRSGKLTRKQSDSAEALEDMDRS